MSNIENVASTAISFDYVISDGPCRGIVDVEKLVNRDEVVTGKMKQISELLGAKKDE